jgi:hypothetical protein
LRSLPYLKAECNITLWRFKEVLTFAPLKYHNMKKLLIAILIVAGLYKSAWAQTKNSSEFGVNVGYNAAAVTTDYQNNNTFKSGFNFGISEDYYFSDSWSLKIKAIYDQKGWDQNVTPLYEVSNKTYNLVYRLYFANYKLNYITVPLMANWHFGRSHNWYLNFGPYAGFLLNAKATRGNADVSQAFNKVDVGVDLGVGIKFPISNIAKFFIELDGQGGANGIFNYNTENAVRNDRSSINFGLSIPLK